MEHAELIREENKLAVERALGKLVGETARLHNSLRREVKTNDEESMRPYAERAAKIEETTFAIWKTVVLLNSA